MRDLYKINRRRIGQQFLWAGYVYTGLETRVQCASAMRSEPNGKVKIIPVYTHVGEKKRRIRSCKSTLQKDNTFLGNHRTDRPSSLQSEGVKAHPNTVAELTIPPGCSEHDCCSCCKSHKTIKLGHHQFEFQLWYSLQHLQSPLDQLSLYRKSKVKPKIIITFIYIFFIVVWFRCAPDLKLVDVVKIIPGMIRFLDLKALSTCP